MKQYHVQITEKALSDMGAIYDYVAGKLQAPETAMRQYNRIAEAIESLELFPNRCQLFDTQPERDMGLRRLLIDNYSVIYVTNEDSVTVLRVLYSSSDLLSRLRED